MTKELFDFLFRTEHGLIVAAVWVAQSVVGRVFPKLKTKPLYARLAPVLPLLACSAIVWIPGTVDPTLGVGSRIMLGIVLGALVANAHKIFGQTVLGRDERINGKKKPRADLSEFEAPKSRR